jgi:carbohydrate kinase (thermoresistant glucokinase family)
MQKVIILMGVSGSGKTAVGKLLSTELNIPFYDGDDFHPIENIKKMKNNIPLNDTDRLPWLEELSKNINSWQENKGAILACSSLKESYRKVLDKNNEKVFWVVLNGSYQLIFDRISNRNNHFMNSFLLKSQIETLELPNYGLHIDISKDLNEIISVITKNIKN